MTDLEKVKNWLLTFPQWEEGGQLYVDYTDAVPGNAGLYPAGLEIISRKCTVTGEIRVQNRYHFALYRITAQEESAAAAQWLMDFQSWVQQQSAAGLAPTFGDEPSQEHIRAEKGKLKTSTTAGTGKYVVMLTAEFIKIY